MKSVITEYPKFSHNLSKTIGKNKKVGSNRSLYSDTKNSEKFLNKKNVKVTIREHAFKGYASTDNVNILNSFNPELLLKDTESAVSSNLYYSYKKHAKNLKKTFGLEY